MNANLIKSFFLTGLACCFFKITSVELVHIEDLNFYNQDARIRQFALQSKRLQGKILTQEEKRDLLKITAVQKIIKKQQIIWDQIQRQQGFAAMQRSLSRFEIGFGLPIRGEMR